jgi:hypothetical protein
MQEVSPGAQTPAIRSRYLSGTPTQFHVRPRALTEMSMTDQNAEFADEVPSTHIEVPVATATDLRRLDTVRSDLLRVHRGLLEAERNRYEKQHGRIANNSAFLQLVINDPWFDWLRPMGQMVLMIDERTSDKKQPLGSVEAGALFEQSLELLKADAEGDAFQRLFLQSIQSSPELAVLVRQVAKGLAGA